MIEAMTTVPGAEPIPGATLTEAVRIPAAPDIPTVNPGPIEPGLLTNLQEGQSIPGAFEQFADQGFIEEPSDLIGDHHAEPITTTTESTPTSGPTPDEIGPEPIVDLATSETTNTPSQDAPLFSYVSDARAALADADAKGVSFEERQKLEIELQHAINKEGLLMSGVKLIEVDREIAEAKKNGTSKEKLAELMTRRNDILTARDQIYTEVFEEYSKFAKRNKERTGKSFEDVINETILKEAEDIRDVMIRGLQSAQKSGIAKNIESAKLRLEASEMHIGIIKKKKGGGIMAMLKGLALTLGVTSLGETLKVSKGELASQKRR